MLRTQVELAAIKEQSASA
jgi:hypothetical protein